MNKDEINYEINNCITDIDTLITLDKRAMKDLENNTHEIEQQEVLTIIREFIRLRNDYNKEKEKNKELNRLKGFEMLDIFNMGKESSRQRIKHDWVEKEKIRKKLKEEQERLKAGFGKMYEESLGNSATRILQELLEERN